MRVLAKHLTNTPRSSNRDTLESLCRQGEIEMALPLSKLCTRKTTNTILSRWSLSTHRRSSPKFMRQSRLFLTSSCLVPLRISLTLPLKIWKAWSRWFTLSKELLTLGLNCNSSNCYRLKSRERLTTSSSLALWFISLKMPKSTTQDPSSIKMVFQIPSKSWFRIATVSSKKSMSSLVLAWRSISSRQSARRATSSSQELVTSTHSKARSDRTAKQFHS